MFGLPGCQRLSKSRLLLLRLPAISNVALFRGRAPEIRRRRGKLEVLESVTESVTARRKAGIHTLLDLRVLKYHCVGEVGLECVCARAYTHTNARTHSLSHTCAFTRKYLRTGLGANRHSWRQQSFPHPRSPRNRSRPPPPKRSSTADNSLPPT